MFRKFVIGFTTLMISVSVMVPVTANAQLPTTQSILPGKTGEDWRPMWVSEDGKPMGWSACRGSIPIYIDPTQAPACLENAIIAHIPRIAKDSGIPFVYAGHQQASPSWVSPGIIVIFRTPEQFSALSGKAGAAKPTSGTAAPADVITSAVVAFNTEFYNSTSPRSKNWVNSHVVTHEFGHALGLSHVKSKNAVMGARVSVKFKNFQKADKIGLRTIRKCA